MHQSMNWKGTVILNNIDLYSAKGASETERPGHVFMFIVGKCQSV